MVADPVEELDFQRGEQGLGDGVVGTGACAALRLDPRRAKTPRTRSWCTASPLRGERPPGPCGRGCGAATAASSAWTASPIRRGAHGPAQQPWRGEVDDGGQIQAPLRGGDVAEIAAPGAVRLVRLEQLAYPVGDVRRRRIWPGQAAPPGRAVAGQAVLGHEALHPLVADPPAFATQRHGHVRRPVSVVGGLEGTDASEQPGILGLALAGHMGAASRSSRKSPRATPRLRCKPRPPRSPRASGQPHSDSGSVCRLPHPEGDGLFQQLRLPAQLGGLALELAHPGSLITGQALALALVTVGLAPQVAQPGIRDRQLLGGLSSRAIPASGVQPRRA